MMKKQKPDTGEVRYVPIDENTGLEIVRKPKKQPKVRLKKKPEDAVVPPTTDKQRAALAALRAERVNFAHKAEYDAFRTCETRFAEGSLESAVWAEWVDHMIKWASNKNASAGKTVIDIYKLSSAILNKESWGTFYYSNKSRVKRAMDKEVSLQSTHKNEEAKW